MSTSLQKPTFLHIFKNGVCYGSIKPAKQRTSGTPRFWIVHKARHMK